MHKEKRYTNRLFQSRKFLSILLFVIIFAPCVLCFLVLKFDRYIAIALITRDVYRGAQLVYEDAGRYNGNIKIVKRYYWVEAEISEVAEYYNQFLPPMVRSEDEDGYWLMALHTPKDDAIYDDALGNVNTNFRFATFCPVYTSYRCITISLVDITQKDYYRIPAMTPDFRWSSLPFTTPTDTGTLIIYTYYEPDY